MRILHLSDPHFGSEHAFARARGLHEPTLAEVVSAAQSLQPVDVLAITGDLFGHDQPREFVPAAKAVRDLMQTLGVPPERVLIVPGNHDIEWRPQGGIESTEWFDRFLAHIGVDYRFGSYPFTRDVVAETSGHRVRFLLLNSCLLESERHPGIGLLGPTQLRAAEAEVKGDERRHGEAPLVALLHHQLLPISATQGLPASPESAKVRLSVTDDGPSALRALIRARARLVLHGHQHQHAVLSYQDLLEDPDHVLHVIAAGSAGSGPQELARSFHVHELSPTGFRSVRYEDPRNDRRFTPDGRPVAVTWGRAPTAGGATAWPHDVNLTELSPPGPGEDHSDLVYVRANVVTWRAATGVIREVLRKMGGGLTRRSPQGGESARITGVYSLAGRWDLLVRMHLDPTIPADGLRSSAWTALADAQQLFDDRSDRSSGVPRYRPEDLTLIDVKEELAFDRSGRLVHVDTVPRRLLGDSGAYDRARCQRAFLEIDVQDRATFLEIVGWFNRDTEGRPYRTIVESFSFGTEHLPPDEHGTPRTKHVAVVELLASCSQTPLINGLNRAIEGLLESYKAQKSTLFCYECQEPSTAHTPVTLTTRAAASGPH